MLFNSPDFKVMQKSMDMLWLKQRVISNNIANIETPGYKAKAVSFRNVLNHEYYKENRTRLKAWNPSYQQIPLRQLESTETMSISIERV